MKGCRRQSDLLSRLASFSLNTCWIFIVHAHNGEIFMHVSRRYLSQTGRPLGQALVALSLLALVVGCDANTSPGSGGSQAGAAKVEPVVVLGNDALVMPVPAVIPKTAPLIEGLEAGQMAAIHLDRCPTDAGFTTAKPLGTLICGERYNVFWDGTKSSWVAIGPNSALPTPDGFGATRALYPGTPPSQRQIIVWGLGLKVGPAMEVSIGDAPIVGTLVHAIAPVPPKVAAPDPATPKSDVTNSVAPQPK
jgi:hypothetical protein